MPKGSPRITTKDPSTKVAHQRLTVLELAEQLGNATEACRRAGMDRTSFYEWKRRFQTHGFEGLKDITRKAGTRPSTNPIPRPRPQRPSSVSSPSPWRILSGAATASATTSNSMA